MSCEFFFSIIFFSRHHQNTKKISPLLFHPSRDKYRGRMDKIRFIIWLIFKTFLAVFTVLDPFPLRFGKGNIFTRGRLQFRIYFIFVCIFVFTSTSIWHLIIGYNPAMFFFSFFDRVLKNLQPEFTLTKRNVFFPASPLFSGVGNAASGPGPNLVIASPPSPPPSFSWPYDAPLAYGRREATHLLRTSSRQEEKKVRKTILFREKRMSNM